MLNTQRLIDAGFDDDELSIITGTFLLSVERMREEIKKIEDIPFTPEMLEVAFGRADEIIEKIKKYRNSKTDLSSFNVWAKLYD